MKCIDLLINFLRNVEFRHLYGEDFKLESLVPDSHTLTHLITHMVVFGEMSDFDHKSDISELYQNVAWRDSFFNYFRPEAKSDDVLCAIQIIRYLPLYVNAFISVKVRDYLLRQYNTDTYLQAPTLIFSDEQLDYMPEDLREQYRLETLLYAIYRAEYCKCCFDSSNDLPTYSRSLQMFVYWCVIAVYRIKPDILISCAFTGGKYSYQEYLLNDFDTQLGSLLNRSDVKSFELQEVFDRVKDVYESITGLTARSNPMKDLLLKWGINVWLE